MLRRFSLSLLSSWIVNPLGIIVAQSFGVANSPIVILVLLITGASVPFQLFMNECIAVAESRGQVYLTRAQIGLLLFFQTIACGAAIYGLSLQRFPVLIIVFLVVFLAISTALSYLVSLWYYRLVMHRIVSKSNAIVIAALPGLTSLLLYLAYTLSASRLPQMAAGFIVATTILPAIVQWQYMQKFRGSAAPVIEALEEKSTKMNLGWLFLAVVALAALAAGATQLRETVAHLSSNYIALFLVALNSMLSLINMLTRTVFLQRVGEGQQRLLGVITIVMVLAGVAANLVDLMAAPLIALISAQLAIAWVIEVARCGLVNRGSALP